MGAIVIIGSVDLDNPIDIECRTSFLHKSYWGAFSDMLDEVLLPDFVKVHKSIKSEGWDFLWHLVFSELPREEFNLVIRLIKAHVTSSPPWHHRDYVLDEENYKKMAFDVWTDEIEPKMMKDPRYEPAA
ncbi:hypothetical protein [Leeia aquatica]|uniref:Uncharacterized protein n=1 Tax=Leeia aquatica TaxID=2725557 RepID=A0A847SA97_9NEIS|nr:hypothetical protein [Leeia aquatica]NLR76974.1 hypothetical protein [Leeia aquatica]